MSIKFEKDPTDFVIKPEDRLNKSNIMKSELDAKTSELGAGHPYDEGDVRDWNAVRAAGYSMKLDGCKGFSVHKDGKEIGCAGSTNPGSPLMSSELRNHFKRAVQIATNHQLSEASASIRDGVQPTFLSGEVWGDEGTIPDDQQEVNIHDGAPLDELKEEDTADEANGGKAVKSIMFSEDDLTKSEYVLGNQGWVRKAGFGKESKMRNVAADGGKPAKAEAYDHVGAIMAHEQGDLDKEGTVKLFQHLVDTGLVNHLQGHYGRTAQHLIAAGIVKPPKSK